MPHTYAEPARDQQRETASPARQAEAPVPSRPPVVCAAPPGAPQGGLLDWFRNKFSSQPEPDEGQEWVDNAYSEVDPAFVTDKPEPDSPLASMAKPYPQEGPGQAPVFETHSFMPRESLDNASALHLHSFIGLRFTQMDPVSNRYTRKRLKAGFGGGSSPIAKHGVLMNDENTQADMSTETPITRDQLEAVMAVIPSMAQEPYNVVTHNCNHFTQKLASMVGAPIPAKLHDTPLGPIGAYKNLANAAQHGQQGRTRFFQGGGIDNGQMSGANNTQLIEHFQETAKTAARRDGVPFALNHGLRDAAAQVTQAATPMRPFMSKVSLSSEAEETQLENITQTVAERAESMIHLRLWKGHPRVNITAMKVIAMANQLHSRLLPERRTITNYSSQELEASLSQRTEAETDAKMRYDQTVRIYTRTHQEDKIASLDRGVKNERLFSQQQISLSSAGDIFLQSIGLQPHALLASHKPARMQDDLPNCEAILEQITSALTSEDGVGVNDYLSDFFQGRDNLTDAQLGALAAKAILGQLSAAAEDIGSQLHTELRKLIRASGSIAALREEDSLENNTERKDIKNIVDRYTHPHDFISEQEQQRRQALLDQVNLMETALATKFNAIRTRSATEQAPQG